MKKNIDELSKEDILKNIYRECLGCQTHNELRIARCDMISCPLHIYIKYIIDVDNIEADIEKKKLLAIEEKKLASVEKKKTKEIKDDEKKLTLKKKPKKGDKV